MEDPKYVSQKEMYRHPWKSKRMKKQKETISKTILCLIYVIWANYPLLLWHNNHTKYKRNTVVVYHITERVSLWPGGVREGSLAPWRTLKISLEPS